MLNKKRYFEEVKELVEKKHNLDTNKFERLFDIAVENIASKGSNGSRDNIKLAEDILKELFSVPVNRELLIPLSFYESEIGKAILQVKFAISNDEIYLTDDVADITGYTTQYINKEAKKGNLKGEQRGKSGKIWLFTGRAVDEYLIKKGKMTLTEMRGSGKMEYEVKEEQVVSVGFEREEEYK